MPPPKGAGHSNYMTAVTEIEGELVEILDVEKILDEISPKEIIVSEDLKVNGKVPTDLKVLVADDSKVALNQVARALENIGVEVIKARDGREAYDLLRVFAANGPIKDSVELVISDVEMPEMDGYTLCASIRQDPTLKDLYVILHTSLSGVFNQSMVKKAGANDFIPKFNPDELAAAVERGIECVESGISGADCIMKNH